LNFSSGEPLNDLHWSCTLGTGIKIKSFFGGGSMFFGKRFWGCAQQLKTEWQKSSAPTVGQETEVTDAHEALRKDVQ